MNDEVEGADAVRGRHAVAPERRRAYEVAGGPPSPGDEVLAIVRHVGAVGALAGAGEPALARGAAQVAAVAALRLAATLVETDAEHQGVVAALRWFVELSEPPRRHDTAVLLDAGLEADVGRRIAIGLRHIVLEPDRALRRHGAELGKVPAQSVDQGSPLPNEQFAHLVSHQYGLLIDRPHGDEAHGRPGDSLNGGLRISGVGLALLDVGNQVDRRHELDGVTQLDQFSRSVMGGGTSLHTQQTWRKIPKRADDL